MVDVLAGQIGTPSLSLLSAAHHAVEGYSEVRPRGEGSDYRLWRMKCYRLMSKYPLWNLRLMPCTPFLKELS